MIFKKRTEDLSQKEPALPAAEPQAKVLFIGAADLANAEHAPQNAAETTRLLQECDLAVAGLRAPKEERSAGEGRETAAWLRKYGVSLVSPAGMLERSWEKYADAFDRRNVVGAEQSGAQTCRPVIQTVNGVRLGFLAFSEQNPDRPSMGADLLGLTASDQVRLLLPQCDHVIVLCSAGLSGAELPLPEWRALFLKLIRAGASVVVNLQGESVQGWERYRHGIVYYGAGTLAVDANAADGASSLAATVTFFRNGRLTEESRTLTFHDGVIGPADETQVERIRQQNELYLHEKAYLLAADRVCRDWWNAREADRVRRVRNFAFRAALSPRRAQNDEDERLKALLSSASERWAALRALRSKPKG